LSPRVLQRQAQHMQRQVQNHGKANINGVPQPSQITPRQSRNCHC
jgi:hypothetical protein